MKQAAEKREFEDAAEYKNLISQIESAGNRQIVRDIITGDATIVVTLEKYNHLFISFVEVKNSMIVGVHEYKLANPLDETTDELTSQAIMQYMAENPVKTLYTDIKLNTLSELTEYLSSAKVNIKQPSRGEKVRILEFAHTNLLNFAYQEEMSGLKNATLSKKTMLELMKKIGF
jgi:excinuclease ABC subunit C